MQLTDVIEARYAVFNKERFKRYALFICQGMSWRLDDLIDWLEEDNETQNRSSRARGKQKAAPKRRQRAK